MPEPRRELLRLNSGVIGEALEMAFRKLPAGRFRMGTLGGPISNEEPAHVVEIRSPFWMAETPVTQAQFSAWRDSEAYNIWRSTLQDEESELQQKAGAHTFWFQGHANRPAEQVTWFEARGYCDWLNALVAVDRTRRSVNWIPGCYMFQLPSEAHWEYACRAGSSGEFANGDGAGALLDIGHFEGNASETIDVRQLAPNAWQLFDMHGNVWEWCEDVWDPRAYRKRGDGWEAKAWTLDDAGEDSGALDEKTYEVVRPKAPARAWRVVRGGSSLNTSDRCRSGFRDWYKPNNRWLYRGFRVCLRLGGAPSPLDA